MKVGPKYDDFFMVHRTGRRLQDAQYDDGFVLHLMALFYKNKNNGASVNPGMDTAIPPDPGVSSLFSEGTGTGGKDQISSPMSNLQVHGMQIM